MALDLTRRETALLELLLTRAGKVGMRPRYAGREAAASPATGFAKRHEEQQRALVGLALGIDDGGDVLRSNAGRPAKKKPACG